MASPPRLSFSPPHVQALDEEELKPKNAKRLRVQHTINTSSKMPRSFNGHTQVETKVLAYVQVRGRGQG